MCLSVTLSIVDPWQSCVSFIRSAVIRCTLLMVIYLDHMCQCGLHAVLWSHIGTLMHRFAAEPHSTAGLLFHSRCPSGTILLTPYSMVWDWRVSRAGPMLFFVLSCFIPTIIFYSFSLSLLSVYRLVLWGWGLRTDRVYITLSQPCTADLFIIISIILHILKVLCWVLFVGYCTTHWVQCIGCFLVSILCTILLSIFGTICWVTFQNIYNYITFTPSQERV